MLNIPGLSFFSRVLSRKDKYTELGNKMNNTILSDHTKESLKLAMLLAIRNAERAAHTYAIACDKGEEKQWALKIFERIRDVVENR
jgi:hypothetical protein